jgi:DNA-binding response OmpR family regulator
MKSILLVDDEENICVELQRTLQGLGYHVEVAHTFESALSCFGKSHFDVIFLEFNLRADDPAQPRTGNGIRLVRQLGGLETSVPILMYTVMEGELYKTTSLDASVDEFISKSESFSSFLASASTRPPARPAERRRNDSATHKPIPRAHGWID